MNSTRVYVISPQNILHSPMGEINHMEISLNNKERKSESHSQYFTHFHFLQSTPPPPPAFIHLQRNLCKWRRRAKKKTAAAENDYYVRCFCDTLQISEWNIFPCHRDHVLHDDIVCVCVICFFLWDKRLALFLLRFKVKGQMEHQVDWMRIENWFCNYLIEKKKSPIATQLSSVRFHFKLIIKHAPHFCGLSLFWGRKNIFLNTLFFFFLFSGKFLMKFIFFSHFFFFFFCRFLPLRTREHNLHT